MADETNRREAGPDTLHGGGTTNGASAHPAGLPGTTGAGGAWEPPSVEEAAELFPGYELLELIARGGMGAVYQARQLSLDRLVAIKLLPLEVSMVPGFADNFRREARLMARLQHPNMVAVHDFGQTAQGHLFIVMEYVEGTNLFELIHGDGLDAEQALAVVAHVCLALTYAHEKGIVHRDIKPANVMIETTGHVKVADFGLARLVEPGADLGSAVTQMAMGTPDYAAPEQAEGLPVDHRADIYSLGVVLYEMLCRKVPKGVFQPPSVRIGCDVRIDAIVTKAMQQQPELRYQSTAEMKADVEQALQPAPERKPDPRMMPASEPKPAQRAPAAVAGSRPAARAVAPGPRRAVAPVAPAKFSPMSLLISLGTGVAALIAVYVAMQPKPPRPPAEPAPVAQAAPTRAKEPELPQAKPEAPIVAAVAAPQPFVPPQPEPPQATVTPEPATPPPKALNPTAQWLAEQEPKWQESFKKEVSGPFDRGVGELKKQYVAGIDAQLTAAAANGELDVAMVLRDEKQRGGEVPPEDAPATLPAIKALRANYRRSYDSLAAVGEAAAKRFTATYDAVLIKQQEMLTKAQRFDEALELKAKREQLAAAWLNFNRFHPGVTATAQPATTRTPMADSTATKKAKQIEDLLTSKVWLHRGFYHYTFTKDGRLYIAEQKKGGRFEIDGKTGSVPFTFDDGAEAGKVGVTFNEETQTFRHFNGEPMPPAPNAAPDNEKVGSNFSGFKRELEINATKLRIKESSVGFGQLNVSDDMIQAHAPSRVVFEIPRGSAKFSATGISWDEDSNRNGTWLYIVKIDGKQVFRSKALREYRNLKVPISVNIPVGAKEIELLTDTMGDGRSDHSAWESPMFR